MSRLEPAFPAVPAKARLLVRLLMSCDGSMEVPSAEPRYSQCVEDLGSE